MDPALESRLRGQIIRRPKEQTWMLKTDSDSEEYKYTCEPGHAEWTPMNSNLQMQSIKILENRPIPKKTTDNLVSSHEETLLLLDMCRQKKADENAKKKDMRIRELAMQQKQRQEEQRGAQQYAALSWNPKTAASTTGGI